MTVLDYHWVNQKTLTKVDQNEDLYYIFQLKNIEIKQVEIAYIETTSEKEDNDQLINLLPQITLNYM